MISISGGVRRLYPIRKHRDGRVPVVGREWRLLRAGYQLCQMLVSHAATLGSVKPHLVGTPRPYEALHYRGSLHRSKQLGMSRNELSGKQGPLKGVGFQPQVDLAYQAAGSKRLRLQP